MTTRADIIAEARTWIKTPHRHLGRIKGVACDCVGVIVMAPLACGLYAPDLKIDGYPRNPDPKTMIRFLNLHMDRVEPANKMRGGDVLLLRPYNVTQHVALLTFDNSMIHAIDPKRGVREHILDERWSRAIVGVWSYRGLED